MKAELEKTRGDFFSLHDVPLILDNDSKLYTLKKIEERDIDLAQLNKDVEPQERVERLTSGNRDAKTAHVFELVLQTHK